MTTNITAQQVRELRELTDAPMMECKKVLQEAGGDIKKAIEALRKAGGAQAEKKAGRIAAEGLLLLQSNAERTLVLEINCETDFVTRDENFTQFANAVSELALAKRIESVADLLATEMRPSESVEIARQNLVAKLGENIQIRRLFVIHSHADTQLGAYVHGGRIAAIVEIKGGDSQLAKDMALQIIASNPLVVDAEDLSAEMLEKEKEIFLAQAQASGKPQAVIDKMVEGRLTKFVNEVTLLGQSFVKDDSITIKTLLERAGAKVLRFVRYEVGEGIEKPTEDFAEAVMDQVRNS